MDLIIIAGMPAAGKSTLAKKIAKAFGYPILEKDDIKEELFDQIGYADRAEKRKLDAAATASVLRCTDSILKSGHSLVLVNNFPARMSEEMEKRVKDWGCRCVTVFLGGDSDVFYTRYVERDANHARHIGHSFIKRYPPHPEDDLSVKMTRQDFYEVFETQGMAEFRMGGPWIEVDATHPETVDVEALICRIRKALEEENK